MRFQSGTRRVKMKGAPSKIIYEELGWQTLRKRQENNILLAFHKIIIQKPTLTFDKNG